MLDIDKVQENRIDNMWKSWSEDGSIVISDVFLSDEVVTQIDEQKVVLESFNVERILSLIPFSNTVFVLVCPDCVDNENFAIFQGLVNSGLIIPVFQERYGYYPPEVVQAIITKPHISVYEFSLFRTGILDSQGSEVVCSHCIDERRAKIESLVRGKRNAPIFRDHLETVVKNIQPYLVPDFDILDEIEDCFRDRDLDRVSQVVDTSYQIRTIRNAQALQAPLLLTDERIDQIVKYQLDDLNELRRVGLELRELIADGLGLIVPTTMPISDYTSLVKEIRPHMLSIMSAMLRHGQHGESEVSLKEVFNGIGDVNREIERILKSKRYLFLEAAVSTVSSNKELLASAFIAAALGLGGSLIGCAGAATGGVATHILKKKGKLQGSVAIRRLGQAIHRDLQPTLRKVVAAYVGANEVPLQVIAVRNRLSS